MSISTATGSLASGMSLESRRLDVSANNVANMLTPGFEASRVVGQETATGGVAPVVQPADEPALPWFPDASTSQGNERTVQGEPARQAQLSNTDRVIETATQMAGSNTNLIIETANQLTAVAAYRAQASALETVDETQAMITQLRA